MRALELTPRALTQTLRYMEQGVATHALCVQKRARINFYDRFTDDLSTPLSPAKASRRVRLNPSTNTFSLSLLRATDQGSKWDG